MNQGDDEVRNHYHCPQCGAHVKADEDGCCATCGADCVVEPCRAKARSVVLPACKHHTKARRAPTAESAKDKP